MDKDQHLMQCGICLHFSPSLSWVSYSQMHSQLTLRGCQPLNQLHFHLESLLFNFCTHTSVYLDGGGVDICISWATPLILCSVGPSGQGVQLTHSFLVTARDPYSREILDGLTPTVYPPIQTV